MLHKNTAKQRLIVNKGDITAFDFTQINSHLKLNGWVIILIQNVVKHNKVIIISPDNFNKNYFRKVIGNQKHIWFYFNPKPSDINILNNLLPDNKKPYLHIKDNLFELAYNQTTHLINIYQSDIYRKTDICMCVIEEIILLINSQYANKPTINDTRIEYACKYMLEHYQVPLLIDDIAIVCALSPSRFAHLFKEKMKITPIRFLERLRIEHAQELLKTNSIAIKNIAVESGFSEPNYFCKVFKRNTGITPSQYAKQYCK